ncbi:MAG: HAD-IA family hydrolase [Alphaproteobacteria bacterium]
MPSPDDCGRLAVFDCDGTLVDSQHAIVAAMTAAWHDHSLPAPDATAIRRTIGMPLEHAIAQLTPDMPTQTHAKLAEGYRDAAHRIDASGSHEAPLYRGVVEVLDALAAAGVLLGIATGKGTRGLTATLNGHALNDRFVTMQTADTAHGKPHPEMLLRAMAETGVAPANTVMIGDTVFDIQMAKNAGVTAIGVSWGYHAPSELVEAGAAVIVENFSELPVNIDIFTTIR